MRIVVALVVAACATQRVQARNKKRRFIQIRQARAQEQRLKGLRPCNATDYALGLPGAWQAAADRRAPAFGAAAVENAYLAGGGASAAYARLPHDYVPADCRLRRFDARDFVARCREGRRLAFLGDSLAEQIYKALVGTLAHSGLAPSRTSCGDGCASDAFSIPEAERFGGFTQSTWSTDVLERFKVSRFDEAAFERVDKAARFGPKDVVVLSLGAHYKNASRYAADVEALLAWIARGPRRRRATWVWREFSPTHFPVDTGSYEDFVRCPKCLKWPLRCAGHALRADASMAAQRWRNDAAAPLLERAAADVRVLPLYELVRGDWRSHPGSTEPLDLDGPACGGDPDRLRRRSRGAAGATKGKCALDCLHLSPKYNHLAVRMLYNLLCFDAPPG